jgi:aspartate carbamoyltransferase catalytic subunit
MNNRIRRIPTAPPADRQDRIRRTPATPPPDPQDRVRPLIRDELLPPAPARRHLLSIGDLTRDDVERLLVVAREFARSLDRDVKKLPALRGRTVVNLFYESSTRTSSSFELAAKRLSADVMSIKASGSAVEKGESLKDTALTIGAYDPDVVVIRHPEIGAPQLVARVTGAHVVNAGDGKHQHPTQALLDLYTIDEELGGVDGLHIAIVGDVLHSRVARSNIQAFLLMGAAVTLVGPPTLIPRGVEAMGCEIAHSLDALWAADIVYVLRMQRERMLAGENYVPSLREYAERWGVTPERLRPGQKVMHPGPMNRGVEIDGAVADGGAALIERQVRSGLVVRMAVLYDLLTHGPAEARVAEIEEVA